MTLPGWLSILTDIFTCLEINGALSLIKQLRSIKQQVLVQNKSILSILIKILSDTNKSELIESTFCLEASMLYMSRPGVKCCVALIAYQVLRHTLMALRRSRAARRMWSFQSRQACSCKSGTRPLPQDCQTDVNFSFLTKASEMHINRPKYSRADESCTLGSWFEHKQKSDIIYGTIMMRFFKSFVCRFQTTKLMFASDLRVSGCYI